MRGSLAMRGMALAFLMVLAVLLCPCSPATAAQQDDTGYQISYCTPTHLVGVREIRYGYVRHTVADVFDVATGLCEPVFLGNNVYIFDITELGHGGLLLVGSGGDWNFGVLFRMDPNNPQWFSQLTLRQGEYIRSDYQPIPGGLYFSTTYYPSNGGPSSRIVRFWDCWNASAAKVANFSMENAWVDIYFGWVEGDNTDPALLAVSGGNKARAYRIIADSVAFVKTFRVNPQDFDFGLFVRKDNKIEIWYKSYAYRIIN